MAETEAPASRRKPPGTATPSIYSHRARRRLYPPTRCPSPLDALERDLKALIAGDLAKLEAAFAAAGAPWTPGRRAP